VQRACRGHGPGTIALRAEGVRSALLAAFCALAQSGGDKLPAAASAADQPDAGNLRTFFELARSDIKTHIITVLLTVREILEEQIARKLV